MRNTQLARCSIGTLSAILTARLATNVNANGAQITDDARRGPALPRTVNQAGRPAASRLLTTRPAPIADKATRIPWCSTLRRSVISVNARIAENTGGGGI